MDITETQRKILEFLHEEDKKSPNEEVESIKLLVELGIEQEKLFSDISYLEKRSYVKVEWISMGFNAEITADGIDFLVNNKEEPSSITQMNFHGDIEQFALGDINNYNTNIYFNALIKAIEESNDIPEEEKEGLIDKIKGIANNQYVASIGSAAIFEGIKALSMGVKPF